MPASDSGYLQYLYVDALQQVACDHDVTLYLDCAIGSFVFVNEPLVWVVGEPGDRDALVEEFNVWPRQVTCAPMIRIRALACC